MEYKRLYIAYGSNINLEQMAYRCPNSKIVSKEMLKGYELEFRGVATIVPNDKSEVPILIWEIDGRDEHSLDRYEGFPNLYRKELFEIEVDGEKKECMAYLMNKGQISPPTSYYYSVINQGYEANGMDTSYLRAALERSVYGQHFDGFQEELEEDDDLQMKFDVV
ncbi:MAG: gamma-glutamylcyclotransferase family protein [Ruminococcus bicirculans (ex Wegman et al. 2014)]|uniref:gamma-glutamylcyclotransferase family protein n=1 Tax=Ruminococcus bicirculans (ex Wegman et al. 2014) TaxID=1160721 RepID=UPI003999545F